MSGAVTRREFSVRYVWNGAKARLRWNTSLPSDPSALNIQNCSMNSGKCSDDITDDAFLKESDKTWKFLLFASLISFIIKEE